MLVTETFWLPISCLKNKHESLYNSTGQNSSWDAKIPSAHQAISRISWNQEVHSRAHNSPPLVLIMSQVNPVHGCPSYLRSVVMLSSYLHLGIARGGFLSGFHNKILHAFLLSSTYHISRKCNLPWFHRRSNIWQLLSLIVFLSKVVNCVVDQSC
jgi:hypothetical protein